MLATVAVPGPVRRLFSYTVPPALAARSVPGVRVLVPFGRRRVTAYLVGLSDTPPPGTPLRPSSRSRRCSTMRRRSMGTSSR